MSEASAPAGIFGVPLGTSIIYANVAISLFDEQGRSYIYGYVPIVVAKCGVFLKEKATEVEGIFRLAGSEKRIKELKAAFDSPDRYGKGLDWTGYTVHDAANILRRYINELPEPIIPLDNYEAFREPLRGHQTEAVGNMDAQASATGNFDPEAAIRSYQALIKQMPPLNRQLLLYILDLLAVFASKAETNKMTTPNLAAVFQPGTLSHPTHHMAPDAYRLNQDVLIFLIENQDSFIFGMPGTGADDKTVKEVQSGAPTPSKNPTTPTTPSRSKIIIGRSSSTASAGAESLRKWGGVRRNVSVSSKHSRNSPAGPSPITLSFAQQHPAGNTGSGVHRSNTVPSRRSPGLSSPNFNADKTSDPPTPSPGLSAPVQTHDLDREHVTAEPAASTAPVTVIPIAPPEVISPSDSEATTPLANPGSDHSSAMLVPKEAETPVRQTGAAPLTLSSAVDSVEKTVSNSPSVSQNRGFLDIFKQSPTSDTDKREMRRRNKLRKKTIPGSALSSAQSSNQSLPSAGDALYENQISPEAAAFNLNFPGSPDEPPTQYTTAQSTPQHPSPSRTVTGTTLKANHSPTNSVQSRSSVTDASEADHVEGTSSGAEKPDKKRRWRFSSPNKDKSLAHSNNSSSNFGSILGAQQSKSTLSSSGKGRKSFQADAPPTVPEAVAQTTSAPLINLPPNGTQQAATQPQPASTDVITTMGVAEPEKKGPLGWIKGKIAERKEREAEKRAKSPPRNRERSASRQSLPTGSESAAGARSRSAEAPRDGARRAEETLQPGV
ncbi:GTPase activating protein (GAP) for Rho1p [Elasticomyces elasticus]|nr:GTPase activating protein (GAP) for Rho1p [Elasticomyces elasticus]